MDQSLENDMGELEAEVRVLEWPASATLTSVALGQAETELMSSRDDANSIVIVITDGEPLNEVSTTDAAKKLQVKARVIWVQVGGSAPTGLINA